MKSNFSHPLADLIFLVKALNSHYYCVFPGKGKLLYICVVDQVSLNPSFTSSSFLCGLAGALASNPVDVVRTRMMNQKSQNHGGHSAYKGTLDCLLQVSSSGAIINLETVATKQWFCCGAQNCSVFPSNLDMLFAIIFKRTILSVMHSSVKSTCLDRKAGRKLVSVAEPYFL